MKEKTMYFNSQNYTCSANASRLTSKSKGFKILQYLFDQGYATKYDCLKYGLGKFGTRQKLRGYYSDYFGGLRQNGIIGYDPKTFEYFLTNQGFKMFRNANMR